MTQRRAVISFLTTAPSRSFVVLQNGAVVGADGFGFVKRPDGSYHKVPQVGIVVQLADLSTSDKGDPFLLKSIGGNYYIAQQANNSSFIYDLIRINGNIVYQYGMNCADEDQKFVAQGLIDSLLQAAEVAGAQAKEA